MADTRTPGAERTDEQHHMQLFPPDGAATRAVTAAAVGSPQHDGQGRQEGQELSTTRNVAGKRRNCANGLGWVVAVRCHGSHSLGTASDAIYWTGD